MQLVAIGQQDAYLTENPTITFWKRAYQRHTNFAVESIEQTFVGQVKFGGTASVNISRNGDLLNKAYIHVKLPALTKGGWAPCVGHRLIKSVTMSIGGQKIDRHTGQWMHLWNRLAGKNLDGLNDMIGGASAEAQTLYIPLHFWWNRTPGMALPLIALQYHEVKIEVVFNDFNSCVTGSPSPVALESAKLYVDYVYIDNEERKRFAQANHEYLIDQVQETNESVKKGNNKIGLNFNHPVKELVWVVKNSEMNSDNANAFDYGVRPSANSWWSYGKDTEVSEVNTSIMEKDTNGPFKIDGVAYKFKDDFMENNNWENFYRVKDNVLFDRADGRRFDGDELGFESSEIQIYGNTHPGHRENNNTVSKARISLNGHDRFSERDGQYFNLVQPYQHHSNMPGDGVYCYSFALEPESEQPSGSCNFSRIDRAELVLESAVSGEATVYAVNFNVLRLMGGMGGVAYAN
jgi:hypothetical protein